MPIAADPAAAKRVPGGHQKALGPLVGAVMREIKGCAEAAKSGVCCSSN